MPKYGPHLKDIGKKVSARLAALNLSPSYAFDENKHVERFYTAPCRDARCKKVVFKMRTEDFPETRNYFRREIRINQLFTSHYRRGGKICVPRFLAGDSAHAPEWMVYDFIAGHEAGDFYNGLDQKYLRNFPLESLLSNLKNMRRMSAFASGEIKLHKERYADYAAAYESYRSRLRPFFTEREIGRGAELLASQRRLLDLSSGSIAHGDFHPGNLLITPEREIAIIDWYYVHLDNLAFDVAFLYLEISDQAFRKRFLSRFVEEVVENEEEFFQLFRLDLLRLVPQKINVLGDALYKIESRRRDYYTQLTPTGIAKLETNLEIFQKALAGENFL